MTGQQLYELTRPLINSAAWQFLNQSYKDRWAILAIDIENRIIEEYKEELE